MFISKHKDAFGVEPVCRVLAGSGWQIAPGTYYAAVRRPPPARAVRDAQVLAGITQMRAEYEEVYGARKTWLALNRRGIPVARCTVERVMRENGLRGARRGRKVRTTIAGKGPGHDALDMALWHRDHGGHRVCAGLIHHSDAGSQREFHRVHRAPGRRGHRPVHRHGRGRAG
jgi:transposase InsO family protein